MKLNVGFVFGGRSVEHEVSVITANQAMHAADSDKYNVIAIYVTKTGQFYTGDVLKDVANYKNMKELIKNATQVTFMRENGQAYMVGTKNTILKKYQQEIDVVVPVIHGTNGEDGTLQGYLDMLELPYAGCDILSSAMGMDKAIMKHILKASGVNVLDFVSFYAREYLEERNKYIEKIENFGYPVIVKPANLGSSVGIKIANDRDNLILAIEYASQYAQKILVERAITNLREINCSVIGNLYEATASVCEEPIGNDQILSYTDKYMSGGKTKSGGMSSLKRKVPADLEKEVEQKIRQNSIDTFKALGCSGVARIDSMIDCDSGEIFVNEINTIPGSLSFYLWEASGIIFTKLIDMIIDIAFSRQREKQNLTFSFESNLFEYFNGSKGAKR